MRFAYRLSVFLSLAFLAGGILFLAPVIDIEATELFFAEGQFPWRYEKLPVFFHNLVQPVSILLGIMFVVAMLYQGWQKRSMLPALFLLLALVIGPGIVTNTILKDNWGRARPYQTVEFGGTKNFSRPLVIENECNDNCSFVGGDAAFGYWFHSFAYVVPPRRRRAVFWSGIGVGLGYSILRVGMGAHFLSDVFFAAVVVLTTSAAL